MNKHAITFLLVFLLAGLSIQANAQHARLVIPEALDVVSINKVKHSSSLFSGGDTKLELMPGQNKIVVEYDMIFDISNDDHERVQSEPFQFMFNVEAGKQYYVKIPSFNSVTSAMKYARKPHLEIVERSTNKTISADITYREFDGTYTSESSKPSATVKSQQAISASTPEASTSAISQTTTTSNDMPLQMLEFWWQQASAQQRKRFIDSR